MARNTRSQSKNKKAGKGNSKGKENRKDEKVRGSRKGSIVSSREEANEDKDKSKEDSEPISSARSRRTSRSGSGVPEEQRGNSIDQQTESQTSENEHKKEEQEDKEEKVSEVDELPPHPPLQSEDTKYHTHSHKQSDEASKSSEESKQESFAEAGGDSSLSRGQFRAEVTMKEENQPINFITKVCKTLMTRKRFVIQDVSPKPNSHSKSTLKQNQKEFERKVLSGEVLQNSQIILRAADGSLWISFKDKNKFTLIWGIPDTHVGYWPLSVSRLHIDNILTSPLTASYAFETIGHDPKLTVGLVPPTKTKTQTPQLLLNQNKLLLPLTLPEEENDTSQEHEESEVEDKIDNTSLCSRLEEVIYSEQEAGSTFQRPLPKTKSIVKQLTMTMPSPVLSMDSYEDELVQLKEQMQVGFESWKDLYKKYSLVHRNERLLNALRMHKKVLLELESEIKDVWAGDCYHEQLVAQIAEKNAKECQEILMKRLNPLREREDGEDPIKKKKINGTGAVVQTVQTDKNESLKSFQ